MAARTGADELVWYGRTAAWIGAAVLLLEAILGRTAGLANPIAVILLAGGFLVFLIGLVGQSQRRGNADAAQAGEEPSVEPGQVSD